MPVISRARWQRSRPLSAKYSDVEDCKSHRSVHGSCSGMRVSGHTGRCRAAQHSAIWLRSSAAESPRGARTRAERWISPTEYDFIGLGWATNAFCFGFQRHRGREPLIGVRNSDSSRLPRGPRPRYANWRFLADLSGLRRMGYWTKIEGMLKCVSAGYEKPYGMAPYGEPSLAWP